MGLGTPAALRHRVRRAAGVPRWLPHRRCRQGV